MSGKLSAEELEAMQTLRTGGRHGYAESFDKLFQHMETLEAELDERAIDAEAERDAAIREARRVATQRDEIARKVLTFNNDVFRERERAEKAEAERDALKKALRVAIECHNPDDYDEATGNEVMCDCCTSACERVNAVLAKEE